MSKVFRALRLARTRILWSWRFYSLGPRTVVCRCRMVGNARAISIGHHSTITDDWSMVDLDPSQSGSQPKIRIGSFCTILYDFQINAAVSVELQDYVLVAPRVFITDSDHIVDEAGKATTLRGDLISSPVVIEHNCWLGVNCVVLKGVRIGHHSIIGANSVVTKDVPPNSVYAGVPARSVKAGGGIP